MFWFWRKKIAVIGNGWVNPNRAAMIDNFPYVVRFNKCDNFERSGTKTSAIVFATFGPAGEMNSSQAVNQKAISLAEEFIFTKHPDILCEEIISPKLFPNCDSTGWRDWSLEISAHHVRGRPTNYIPSKIYRLAVKLLSEAGATEPFEPSSGFLALMYLRSKMSCKITLFGFTHEGWTGHPFAAEKAVIDQLSHVERILD